MALFTKLFERNLSPYDIPGARWYKIHLTSDGTNVTIKSKDLPAGLTSSGTVTIEVSDFEYIDHVYKFNNTSVSPSASLNKDVYLATANAWIQLFIPAAHKFSELDLYVYGVKK